MASDSPTISSSLEERIESEFAAARERIAKIQEEAGREFDEVERRREKFESVASDLVEKSGHPLQQLASHFEHAEYRRTSDRGGYHGEVVFKHTPQFPASVQLTFDLMHDEEIRKLILSYHLRITPVFIEFEPSDSIAFDLDSIDEAKVRSWVEDKIVSFVNTYLKIEIAERYQERNLVTDPVAMTRVSKNLVKSECEYNGHTYFFISDRTRSEFDKSPETFVQG